MANLDLLPPDIRAAANNAWQRAQEREKTRSPNTTSQGFGSAALLNTLNADVREAREKRKTGFNSLDTIPNPETQRAFEKAFALSERLVSHIGLSAPTPEQMVSVGVNLQYLAEQFALMEQEEGVAPHVVLAPHGLGKQNWLAMIKEIATDKTIPNNPLDQHPLSDIIKVRDVYGLSISPEITDDIWHNLDQASTFTTTPALNILPTYKCINGLLNIEWTLRLISARERPMQLGKPYQNIQKLSIEHQTLVEGLTDKFTTVLAGGELTDRSASSWCLQPDMNAHTAPYIHWGTFSDRVCVKLADLRRPASYDYYSHIGIRPSVG